VKQLATTPFEAVVGDMGAGKSYFATHTLAAELRRKVDLLVYWSPNMDDDWPHGPGLHVNRLWSVKMPRAFRIHADPAELKRWLERAAERYTIGVLLDESHKVFPNFNEPFQDPYPPAVRRELRAWNAELLRQGRHGRLRIVFLTPTIAGMHPDLWRACQVTHYFVQKEPRDLRAIEDRYGAEAALQVAKLPKRVCISVDREAPPVGWNGYQLRLQQKVDRLKKGIAT